MPLTGHQELTEETHTSTSDFGGWNDLAFSCFLLF